MKSYLLIFVMLGISLIGCDSNNTGESPECLQEYLKHSARRMKFANDGKLPTHLCDYMSVLKDGAEWVGHASAYNSLGDTIWITGTRDEETVGFRFPFKGVGEYKISSDVEVDERSRLYQAIFEITVGFDAISATYWLTEDAVVHITSYDPETKLVEGSFTSTFRSDRTSETVNFTNGKFKVHLE